MCPQPRTLTGQSCAGDAAQAVRELHRDIAQPDTALVVFFCSVEYSLDVVAAEMRRQFDTIPVIGCTTAGEIGPAGYRDHSIAGVSFPASSFTAQIRHIDGLREFDFAEACRLTQEMLRDLQAQEPSAAASNSFALMLIDGLSVREEPVARFLQGALGEIALVGGSAGDGSNFEETFVYVDGAFRTDSAVVALLTTPLPFKIFKTDHFHPTDHRVVVTAADAAHRLIERIDDRPAAGGYARLAGVDLESLDTRRFAEQPLVVMIDGTGYVRSIQQANPDGSLTMFCAIEEGVVLRIARGGDLVANLEDAFADIAAAIGHPQLVLGCDCVLRKVEIAEQGLVDRVEKVFAAANLVGFSGYGEQIGAVHVNQTLTGVAIGEPTGSCLR